MLLLVLPRRQDLHQLSPEEWADLVDLDLCGHDSSFRLSW